MRDVNVVDNKVTCPNRKCGIQFCWICLDKAQESNSQIFDHFGELNFAHCPGSMYQDIREIRNKHAICFKRLLFVLTMPVLSVYTCC